MSTISIPELSPTQSPLGANDYLVIEKEGGGTRKMLYSEFTKAVAATLASNANNITTDTSFASVKQLNPGIDNTIAKKLNSLMISSDYGKILIPENTDLDTIVQVGTYYCMGNGAALTMSNCPTDYAFTMEVTSGINPANINTRAESTYTHQIIHTYMYDHFERYKPINSTWRPWTRIPGNFQSGRAVTPSLAPGIPDSNSIDVTFAHPYKSGLPAIMLQLVSTRPDYISLGTSNITLTGFKIRCYNHLQSTLGGGTHIYWFAIDMFNGRAY